MPNHHQPANQKRRIAKLRASALLILPAILFVRPSEALPELFTEIMENLGALLVVFGVLGRFWSILYIGGHKNTQVVQDGPYSICRHPLYLFSTVATLGFGMMLGSVVLALVITGLVYAILHQVAGQEERFLNASFGHDYASYAARTPRVLPRVQQFATPSFVTFNVPVLRRNFSDALVFLMLIPLADMADNLKDLPHWPTIAIF